MNFLTSRQTIRTKDYYPCNWWRTLGSGPDLKTGQLCCADGWCYIFLTQNCIVYYVILLKSLAYSSSSLCLLNLVPNFSVSALSVLEKKAFKNINARHVDRFISNLLDKFRKSYLLEFAKTVKNVTSNILSALPNIIC